MSLIQDGLSAGRDRTALIEESILPTRASQRPIGTLGYAWIWVGIAVIIATYSLGATGIQGGFDHSGFVGERGRERAGVSRMPNTVHPSREMAEVLADLRPGLPGAPADLGERQLVRIIVDAQLRAFGAFDEVRLQDAGFGSDESDQPSHTTILAVGGVGKQNRDVETKRLGHDRAPQEASRVKDERSGRRRPARWAAAPAAKAPKARTALRRVTHRFRFIAAPSDQGSEIMASSHPRFWRCSRPSNTGSASRKTRPSRTVLRKKAGRTASSVSSRQSRRSGMNRGVRAQ